MQQHFSGSSKKMAQVKIRLLNGLHMLTITTGNMLRFCQLTDQPAPTSSVQFSIQSDNGFIAFCTDTLHRKVYAMAIGHRGLAAQLACLNTYQPHSVQGISLQGLRITQSCCIRAGSEPVQAVVGWTRCRPSLPHICSSLPILHGPVQSSRSSSK